MAKKDRYMSLDDNGGMFGNRRGKGRKSKLRPILLVILLFVIIYGIYEWFFAKSHDNQVASDPTAQTDTNAIPLKIPPKQESTN